VKCNYGNLKAVDFDKKASLFHMCDEEQWKKERKLCVEKNKIKRVWFNDRIAVSFGGAYCLHFIKIVQNKSLSLFSFQFQKNHYTMRKEFST
jgi:hypothetical protein